jgi:hypothetical protein
VGRLVYQANKGEKMVFGLPQRYLVQQPLSPANETQLYRVVLLSDLVAYANGNSANLPTFGEYSTFPEATETAEKLNG